MHEISLTYATRDSFHLHIYHSIRKARLVHKKEYVEAERFRLRYLQ